MALDPITAFTVAKGAIEAVKKGISLAKDSHSLIQELDKFFEAKDVINEAAKEEQKKQSKTKSLNKSAMENVMRRRQLVQAEKQLKESLYWSGQADVWEELIKERARLKREQQKADELAKYKKRLFLERLRDGTIITGLLGFTAWIIVTLIEMILGKGK